MRSGIQFFYSGMNTFLNIFLFSMKKISMFNGLAQALFIYSQILNFPPNSCLNYSKVFVRGACLLAKCVPFFYALDVKFLIFGKEVGCSTSYFIGCNFAFSIRRYCSFLAPLPKPIIGIIFIIGRSVNCFL